MVLGTRPSFIKEIIYPKSERPRQIETDDELRNIKISLINKFKEMAET